MGMKLKSEDKRRLPVNSQLQIMIIQRINNNNKPPVVKPI